MATPWSLVENGISVCGVTVFIHPPVCMIVGSESLLDDTEFGFCCKMQFYAAPEKKKERKRKKRFRTCTSLTFTWWKWIKCIFTPPPPHRHLNMKVSWGTCAYWRTKVGGIQCKMSLKKKKSFGVGSKNMGSFWCELPKKGAIQCAKMQFQAKIYKFHAKIAAKLLHFSKCMKSAQKLAICM